VAKDWGALAGAPVVGGAVMHWPSKTVGVHEGCTQIHGANADGDPAAPLILEFGFLDSWSLQTKSVHRGARPEVRI